MPERWQVRRLAEIASLDIERVPVHAGETYPVAGVLNAGKGLFWREPLASEDTNYPVLHKLRAGQIVMRKLTAWEGPVAVVPAEFEGAHASPEFPTFTIQQDVLDPRYMSILCTQPSFWQALKGRSTGTVQRRKRVSPEQFLNITIPVPPLVEQGRIVDLVQAAVSSAAAAEVVARSAADLAKALRQGSFRSPTRQTVLSQVAEVVMGRQRSPKHAEGEHVLPYLRAANVKDGRLDLDDVLSMNFSPTEQATYALEPLDVLVSEGAGSRAAVGASAVYRGEVPGVVCFQNTLVRLRATPDGYQPGLLAHWARWAYESGGFADVASGTNILHIGSRRLQQMQCPDFTPTEQSEVLETLEAAQSFADVAAGHAADLRALAAALATDLTQGNHLIPSAYDRLLAAS